MMMAFAGLSNRSPAFSYESQTCRTLTAGSGNSFDESQKSGMWCSKFNQGIGNLDQVIARQ